MSVERIQEIPKKWIDAALQKLWDAIDIHTVEIENTLRISENISELWEEDTQKCCSILDGFFLKNPETAKLLWLQNVA